MQAILAPLDSMFFDNISSGVGVTIRKAYTWIGDLLLNNNVWKIPRY
jgi:hypothetical protein